MRRATGVALGVFLMAMPVASADELHRLGEPTPVVFQDALPCAAACAYWLDAINCNTDCEDPLLYFQACRAPFPEGSWDDVAVVAPTEAVLLEAWIEPQVDWDLFLCAPNGETFATPWGFGGPCTIKPLVGCEDRHMIRVWPGQTVLLRAYNWFDPFPAPGAYVFWGLS